ncbi:hypothetical protein LTR87_013823 [Friedmanniomyces endolithicus]|nr:hypothetical protein LTR87_013823 [Friedmanniomyces endolithicus]
MLPHVPLSHVMDANFSKDPRRPGYRQGSAKRVASSSPDDPTARKVTKAETVRWLVDAKSQQTPVEGILVIQQERQWAHAAALGA